MNQVYQQQLVHQQQQAEQLRAMKVSAIKSYFKLNVQNSLFLIFFSVHKKNLIHQSNQTKNN